LCPRPCITPRQKGAEPRPLSCRPGRLLNLAHTNHDAHDTLCVAFFLVRSCLYVTRSSHRWRFHGIVTKGRPFISRAFSFVHSSGGRAAGRHVSQEFVTNGSVVVRDPISQTLSGVLPSAYEVTSLTSHSQVGSADVPLARQTLVPIRYCSMNTY
jgi:hypothetical protein